MAGHRHIAGIFVYDNYQGQEKYNGFMRSLIKYDAVFRDEYVRWCTSEESHDARSFSRALWKYIRSLPKATALVCCNYMILTMVLDLFAKKGVRVPEDYSIVCFDYSGTDWQESGITSSVHPGFDMGVLVGENILKMVDDPDFRSHDYSYTFAPRIHEGGSIREIG
jgi:GntR family transcriptional regulator of arabinose operon